MKAMILAAGLGTRLKPFTDQRPKALLEINGITLLEHIVTRLIKFGYTEFIINVHHFADHIRDFVKSRNYFDTHIEFSDESDLLLDTGGGLKKASWFFNDGKPFLVHNVDILTDLDLKALYNSHLEHNPLATLAVRKRETSRYFLFDEYMHLYGWTNKKTGEMRVEREVGKLEYKYAFSGIQIVSPEIFPLITEEGKFSLTDLYLRLCRENNITGYIHNDGYWSDVGKPEELAAAAVFLQSITNKEQ
jgi:NDP-sugar pyrophosphorylase family protein